MPTLPESDIVRREEWSAEMEGMLSTMIVQIYKGERVHPAVIGDAKFRCRVSPEIARELGLPLGEEAVDSERERFYEWHPYDVVKDALIEAGFSYVSST